VIRIFSLTNLRRLTNRRGVVDMTGRGTPCGTDTGCQHLDPLLWFDDAIAGASLGDSTNYGYGGFEGYPGYLSQPTYSTAETSAMSDIGVTAYDDKQGAQQNEDVLNEGNLGMK
jgi:hypothetical protein